MKQFSTAVAGFVVAMALAGGVAQAAEMKMSATLSGAEEVPPVESAATGMADITYDSATRKLSWTQEYSGLSGDPTAAHFHGPAEPGANAPPVVPVPDPKSGAMGSAELTEAQAADLEAGKWYFNVHTAANPNGEIRGQVMKAQ